MMLVFLPFSCTPRSFDRRVMADWRDTGVTSKLSPGRPLNLLTWTVMPSAEVKTLPAVASCCLSSGVVIWNLLPPWKVKVKVSPSRLAGTTMLLITNSGSTVRLSAMKRV